MRPARKFVARGKKIFKVMRLLCAGVYAMRRRLNPLLDLYTFEISQPTNNKRSSQAHTPSSRYSVRQRLIGMLISVLFFLSRSLVFSSVSSISFARSRTHFIWSIRTWTSIVGALRSQSCLLLIALCNVSLEWFKFERVYEYFKPQNIRLA